MAPVRDAERPRPDRRGRLVLVIDDDPAIRDLLGRKLSAHGFRVESADDGASGLARARELGPSAIVLDVMMPELDGPATLERLRADPVTAAIPVVFLTAKVQAADHRRFATMPIAGVLAKPFDPMELPGQVAGVLGWTQ